MKAEEAEASNEILEEKLTERLKSFDELKTTIGNLQENIAFLSCSLNEAERHKETLMITISKLQTENKNAYESFQLTLQQKEEENEKLLKKQEKKITQLQRESLNKAQMIVQCQERIKELEKQKDKESFNKVQMIVQIQKRIKELEEQSHKFIQKAQKSREEATLQLKKVFALDSDEGEVVTKYDRKRKFPFSGEENETPFIPMICNEEAVPRKSLLLGDEEIIGHSSPTTNTND